MKILCSSPEPVEDDRALVELVARVQQLGGHDGGVTEAGRLTADLLAVQDDVLTVGSGEDADKGPSISCRQTSD